MTVVVTTHNDQEEQELIAFLETNHYNYNTEDSVSLTGDQQKEILKRDERFLEGVTVSKPWDEIKKNMNIIYR